MRKKLRDEKICSQEVRSFLSYTHLTEKSMTPAEIEIKSPKKSCESISERYNSRLRKTCAEPQQKINFCHRQCHLNAFLCHLCKCVIKQNSGCGARISLGRTNIHNDNTYQGTKEKLRAEFIIFRKSICVRMRSTYFLSTIKTSIMKSGGVWAYAIDEKLVYLVAKSCKNSAT